MAMMTGEGEGGGGSWAGSPPRRGVSAHLERRSVTPPAGAVSLFRSTFRQKKNKKKINLGEVPPGGTFRPGKAWKGSNPPFRPRRGGITAQVSFLHLTFLLIQLEAN